MKDTLSLSLFLVPLVLVSTGSAQTVQYDTDGFEPGSFTAGELAGFDLWSGQDGWLVTGDGSGTGMLLSGIQVQGTDVHSGSQAVTIDPSGWTAGYAHLRRNTIFDMLNNPEPIVEIALDMRIDSSAQPTEAWGLQAQGGPSPATGLFRWNIFTDDHIHIIENDAWVDTGFVFTRDEWHRVVTYVDFQNQRTEIWVDGVQAGSAAAEDGVGLMLFSFASIRFGGMGDDRMLMDNFRIRTVDEIVAEVGTRYCQSGPNSTGQAATMDASGSNSVAANDLVLRADSLPALQPGLFYFGDAQANLSFGNGTRCVGGTVVRFPVQYTSGGAANLSVDLTSLPGGASIGVGDTRNFQYWYRDPANMGACGAAWNLSNALGG